MILSCSFPFSLTALLKTSLAYKLLLISLLTGRLQTLCFNNTKTGFLLTSLFLTLICLAPLAYICSLHTWPLQFYVSLSRSEIASNTSRFQNALARAVVAAPKSCNPDHILNLCTGSRYRNTLNTKLFPWHIRSFSLLICANCSISS